MRRHGDLILMTPNFRVRYMYFSRQSTSRPFVFTCSRCSRTPFVFTCSRCSRTCSCSVRVRYVRLCSFARIRSPVELFANTGVRELFVFAFVCDRSLGLADTSVTFLFISTSPDSHVHAHAHACIFTCTCTCICMCIMCIPVDYSLGFLLNDE